MVQINTVTDATFQEQVLNNPRPVVVDFWAAWCGPCRLQGPIVEKLAEKYAGFVDVAKLDVDANPEVAGALQIMSIPVVALFRQGEPPIGLLGLRSLEQLEEGLGLAQFASQPEPPAQS
jgi:thioredoxin 1